MLFYYTNKDCYCNDDACDCVAAAAVHKEEKKKKKEEEKNPQKPPILGLTFNGLFSITYIGLSLHATFTQWEGWSICRHPLRLFNPRSETHRPMRDPLRRTNESITKRQKILLLLSQFSLVQDSVYTLGKAHINSTLSSEVHPNVAFQTVPVLSLIHI